MAGLGCLNCSNIESLLFYFHSRTKGIKWECFPLFLKFNFETLKESQSFSIANDSDLGLMNLQDDHERTRRQLSLRRNEM